MELDIQTAEVFLPLLGEQRYKDAHGGRASGKSHFFAESLVERCLMRPGTRWVCIREVQHTLEQSVKHLIEAKIQKLDVGSKFKSFESVTEAPGDGLIMYKGMQNYTAESIKSIEDVDGAWVEEAQAFSQHSLNMLYPTIRKPHSEVWFSRNRRSPKDPVDVFFRDNEGDADFISIEANYWDNPWLPEVSRRDMERDRRRDPDKYQHVWCGGYQAHTQARVFNNWRVEDFDTPKDVQRFYYGGDWGYSVDPSVCVRMFIKGRTLFIDYESYAVGCEIDYLPFLFGGFGNGELLNKNMDAVLGAKRQPWAMGGAWRGVPGVTQWPLIGDSARPETISYMRNHGFPQIRAAKKGAGSIEDGVEFLRAYDVVINPRCRYTIDEFTNFSYKVDKKTEEVLPILGTKKNHVIDSARYALEPLRRATGSPVLWTTYNFAG